MVITYANIKKLIDTTSLRDRFLDLIKNHPDKPNLKSMSIALGRNPAYLHQFIHRGSPRILPEQLRHRLAAILGVDERLLRQHNSSADDAFDDETNTTTSLQSINFLDHPSQASANTQPWFLPEELLRKNGVSSAKSIRLAVVGDTTVDHVINPGDVVMLDLSDQSPHRAGYFGIDGGDHIRVRYLETAGTKSPVKLFISHDSKSGGYVTEKKQHQHPRASYLSQPHVWELRMIKHSLSIRGHRTSVSLEQPFWDALQQIASRRGISVSALITEIDASRTLSGQGGPINGLSSAIRVFILNDTLARIPH